MKQIMDMNLIKKLQHIADTTNDEKTLNKINDIINELFDNDMGTCFQCGKDKQEFEASFCDECFSNGIK